MRIQFQIFKGLFIAFLCFGSIQTNAQDLSKNDSVTFRIALKIPISSKILTCDKLGNIYVINESDRLVKYNSAGELLSTLNYNYSGSISSIDVTNPMEIFLFYKELNMVILLDNNLAFRGKINLQDWGITQAACIARSYENGIWVFDAGDLQLKKFNREGKLLQSSGNALDFAGADRLNPSNCYENGNRLLLSDSLNGLFLFDVFAGFIKRIPVQHVKSVQLLEKEIVYLQNEIIVIYNLQNSTRKPIPSPNFTAKSVFKLKSDTFIFQTSDSILITNMAK